ncbi:flagellar export protein FliJ [Methylocucumis oryzae]|uniref:Flagellar FliJ protein n=1 Tax=Methylocucumis oryzae TaxID=1632867 RepID=A0A0F3IIK5_9GAMM|nr:flagellar export protein FliJ [Methylocucumis oryzae]KJV06610.1 flagellar export protein FliJ [Methylocucumis oryzae]
MKKSTRIQTLVELNARQESSALTSMGLTQQKLQDAQAQIEHLKNYRREYQQKYMQLLSAGTKMGELLEFRSFIEKLDKAILGQEQALIGIEQEAAEKTKHWQTLHHKTDSLQKICTQAKQAELKHEDKREQSAQDERTSRSFRSHLAQRF